MAKSNENNPSAIVVNMGTLSTAGVYPLCNLPKNFIVESIKLLDKAGIAASDTDYVTLTVKKGSTALAALDTRAANQGAVTAVVAKSFALDAGLVAGLVTSGVPYEVGAGDLTLTYAEGGTGTLTSAQVQLNGYWK